MFTGIGTEKKQMQNIEYPDDEITFLKLHLLKTLREHLVKVA